MDLHAPELQTPMREDDAGFRNSSLSGTNGPALYSVANSFSSILDPTAYSAGSPSFPSVTSPPQVPDQQKDITKPAPEATPGTKAHAAATTLASMTGTASVNNSRIDGHSPGLPSNAAINHTKSVGLSAPAWDPSHTYEPTSPTRSEQHQASIQKLPPHPGYQLASEQPSTREKFPAALQDQPQQSPQQSHPLREQSSQEIDSTADQQLGQLRLDQQQLGIQQLGRQRDQAGTLLDQAGTQSSTQQHTLETQKLEFRESQQLDKQNSQQPGKLSTLQIEFYQPDSFDQPPSEKRSSRSQAEKEQRSESQSDLNSANQLDNHSRRRSAKRGPKGPRKPRSPQRDTKKGVEPVKASGHNRSQSGVSKPKTSRRSKLRNYSRAEDLENSSNSMALLAPGLIPGMPLIVPHVSERPPGGYYWALINNRRHEFPGDVGQFITSGFSHDSTDQGLSGERVTLSSAGTSNDSEDTYARSIRSQVIPRSNREVFGGYTDDGSDNMEAKDDDPSSTALAGHDSGGTLDSIAASGIRSQLRRRRSRRIKSAGSDNIGSAADTLSEIDEEVPDVDEMLMDDDEDDFEDYGDDDDDDDDYEFEEGFTPHRRRGSRKHLSHSLNKNRRKRRTKFDQSPIRSPVPPPSIKSESDQFGHLNYFSDQPPTVPIQMCQPPLCNILPAYPQALDADPQPRSRKQSKYTAEQDQLILDLKSQGKGWFEIANLAKCQNQLAARNRYQVLIGQQGGGTFIWTSEDCAALQDSLDEGERAKWLFIAQDLSRKLNFDFSIDMVHYKIASIFAERPDIFGVLKTKDPTLGGAPFDRILLYEDEPEKSESKK